HIFAQQPVSRGGLGPAGSSRHAYLPADQLPPSPPRALQSDSTSPSTELFPPWFQRWRGIKSPSLRHRGEELLCLVLLALEDELQAFLTVKFPGTADFWIHLGIGVYTDSRHAQFIANHFINAIEGQLLLEG